MARTLLCTFAALCLGWAFVACGANEAAGEEAAELGDETQLLEDEDSGIEVEVSPNHLLIRVPEGFTFAKPIIPGAVLVGLKGGGYLREVTSVESIDEGLLVHTQPASLKQALKKANFNRTFRLADIPKTLGPPGPNARPDPSAGKADGGTVALAILDLGAEAAFGGETDGGESWDFELLEGSFEVDPSFFLSGQWGFKSSKQEVSIGLKGSLDLDFLARVEAAEGFTTTVEKSVVGDYPYYWVLTFSIGYVPVALVFSLDIIVGVEIEATGPVEHTFGAHVWANNFEIRADYDDEKWTSSYTPDFHGVAYEPDWSVNTDVDVRVFVRPEFRTTLYGVVGPETDQEFYIGLAMDIEGNSDDGMSLASVDRCWDIYGGTEAHMGIVLTAGLPKLAEYEVSLGGVEESLDTGCEEENVMASTPPGGFN